MWWAQATPLSLPSVLENTPWSTESRHPHTHTRLSTAVGGVQPPVVIIGLPDYLEDFATVDLDSLIKSGWWSKAGVHFS